MQSRHTTLRLEGRKENAWFPSRALLDSELGELILGRCPMTWEIEHDNVLWKTARLFSGVNGTRAWVLEHSIAIQTLSDAVHVLGQSRVDKPETTFSRLPGIIPVLSTGQTIRVKPNSIPQAHGRKDSISVYPYLYAREKISFNFVTCAGSEKDMSFYIFLQPFNLNFWKVAIPSFLFLTIG